MNTLNRHQRAAFLSPLTPAFDEAHRVLADMAPPGLARRANDLHRAVVAFIESPDGERDALGRLGWQLLEDVAPGMREVSRGARADLHPLSDLARLSVRLLAHAALYACPIGPNLLNAMNPPLREQMERDLREMARPFLETKARLDMHPV